MGNKSKFVEGALIGAVIGAAAGMLLAPKSGKKLQKDLERLSADFFKALAPRLKKIKKVGEKEYRALVQSAVNRFAVAKKLTKKETDELLRRAQGYWKNIQADF